MPYSKFWNGEREDGMIEECWCGAEAIRGEDEVSWCLASQFHDPVRRAVEQEPRVLYLAGPMSGYEDCNYPAFNAEAARLREHGFTIHNPAEIGDMGSQYATLLRKDIRLILESEGIALMEGWWASTGARLEVHIAGVLGLPVRSVHDWQKLMDATGSGND